MKNQKVWVWVGVAVIAIILILAVAGVMPKGPQNGPEQPAGGGSPTPAYANKGSVVPQFPKELILDSAAQVSASYAVNYSASLNQYTAEWNSSSSMADLYAKYKAYFSANGWTLTSDVTKYSFMRGLYATKGNADASVAIVANANKGSKVTVSYLLK